MVIKYQATSITVIRAIQFERPHLPLVLFAEDIMPLFPAAFAVVRSVIGSHGWLSAKHVRCVRTQCSEYRVLINSSGARAASLSARGYFINPQTLILCSAILPFLCLAYYLIKPRSLTIKVYYWKDEANITFGVLVVHFVLLLGLSARYIHKCHSRVIPEGVAQTS
jgi:hypothetical protein